VIPQGTASVVVFLLLIAPGLLFDLLADRRRPTAKESAFREAGRVVLASIAFGAIAWAVVWGLALAFDTTFVNPAKLASAGDDAFVRRHQGPLVLTLLVQTAFACAFAWGVDEWLRHRAGDARAQLAPRSAWLRTFRDRVPSGTVPYVLVRLHGGVRFQGSVWSYSADLESESRELVLAPPLLVAKSGEGLQALPAVYERLIIAGDQIEWMAVKYDVPPTPGSPASMVEELA